MVAARADAEAAFGHETTSTALTWTLWLLARHPGALARLRAEVDALGGRAPTPADLPALAHTRRALLEGIRAFDEPHTIGGYDIPADQVLVLCPWVTHRLPDCWPHPRRFDPDRFDPARFTGRARHAYIPFAGGPHMCIGNELALVEGVVTLAMLAQRCDVELVDRGPVPRRVVFTITPARPIRVRLRPRGT